MADADRNSKPRKATSRRSGIRNEVRKERPSARKRLLEALHDEKLLLVGTTAMVFIVLATLILSMRSQVVMPRPGQVAQAPIVSRTGFTMIDPQRLQREREDAKDAKLQIFRPAAENTFDKLEGYLLGLPDRVDNLSIDSLPDDLKVLDNVALVELQYHEDSFAAEWKQSVRDYVNRLRAMNLILLDPGAAEIDAKIQLADGTQITPVEWDVPPALVPTEAARKPTQDKLAQRLSPPAYEHFSAAMFPKIITLTTRTLGPTHEYDESATAAARDAAAAAVPRSAGEVLYRRGQILVPGGDTVGDIEYALLHAENEAFRATLGTRRFLQLGGILGGVTLLTGVLGIYLKRFQPRVLRNTGRALGLAVMMLAALLVAQLAALGGNSVVLLGIGPVLLVGMILTVAYDGRFSMGISTILAVLVTLGTKQGVEFFVVAFAGLVTCCFLLDDVRSRIKLLEVGGLTGVVTAVAMFAVGLLDTESLAFTLQQSLYAAIAGLGSGGVVLCILPLIERAFNVTTGLTLLEFQDHPLLRKLALEAPGTYNHSLQVANLSEEAAKAIGADGLLCRVACYYHDIGKLRKPDYFIENQTDGCNRHMNLNPSMSLLVIVGHVKDGVEMAREYGLPKAFIPFIQQHHGTTLVEYFYREACQRREKELAAQGELAGKPVEDVDYRYPGPRPRSRETAIVMLSDCCESAVRAMGEPTPQRIEQRVQDLLQKRLTDGQFDECPLTMRDLEIVRKTLVKSLVAAYHGRIAYPSDEQANKTRVSQTTRTGDRPGSQVASAS